MRWRDKTRGSIRSATRAHTTSVSNIWIVAGRLGPCGGCTHVSEEYGGSLTSTANGGKSLAVAPCRRGCPYCKRLCHLPTLTDRISGMNAYVRLWPLADIACAAHVHFGG